MQHGATIDIGSNTIIRAILIVLGVIFVYLLRDVLFVLFFAIMIASAIGSFATSMQRHSIPRVISVLFIYVAFFGLLALFLSLVVPAISTEVNQITQVLPNILTDVSSAFESAETSDAVSSISLSGELENFIQSVSQFLQVSSQSFVSFLVSVFGGMISLLAVIVISFYFSVMPEGVASFFTSVLPDRFESYVLNLWEKSERKVGRWFQGQVLLALAVGLLVFVGLSLMNVKYAILLAIIAMLMEVVPIVGPVIAAIPAIGLAYVQSPSLALWVALLYLGIQQLENHALTPIILGKSVGLHPVTVIIAILIGGKLAGILGILVSVPLAVVIVEIWNDLAQQRQTQRTLRNEG